MRGTRVGALLTVLLAVGCTVSVGKPEARPTEASPTPSVACHATLPGPKTGEKGIVLRGCIAGSDGRPVRATVVVAHEGGFLESLDVAVGLIATAGLSCLTDVGCLGPEHPAVATRTDAKGQFRLVIPPGADAAQTGHDRVFIVLPSGVQVVTRFKVREAGTGDVVLEPVRDWVPRFAFSAQTGVVRFAPMDGIGEGYHLAVGTSRDRAIHRLPVPPSTTLDPHLLPPGQYDAWITADIGSATYSSPSRHFTQPQRSLSLNASCTVTTSKGVTRKAAELDRCRMGDGDWQTTAVDEIYVCAETFATDDCLSEGWSVNVDLGRVKRLRDVVLVSSYIEEPVLEVSADGRRWQPWGPLGPSGGDVLSGPRSAPLDVRYLRITGDSLAGITELAAFG